MSVSPPLPQNPEAEKCALAMLALNQSLAGEFPWTVELFFHPAHALIFQAIDANFREGLPGTWYDIGARLRSEGNFEAVGSEGGLLEVVNYFSASGRENARYYFRLLTDARAYRDTFLAVQKSLGDLRAMRLPLTEFLETLCLAADTSAADQHKQLTMKDHVSAVFDELEETEAPELFATGLPGLDRLLGGGIERGELAVVAAETGGGKSILLAMAALTNALAGKPVAVFSLEMPGRSLVKRMAAHLAGVTMKARHQKPSAKEMDRISEGLIRMETLPITIVDTKFALPEIEAETRRLIGRGQAELIIVDYAQLVEHKGGDSREQVVSEVARRLKNIAMANRRAVLTASQLNDEGKLRESRAIGHHADHVVLIKEDELRVMKNRRGPKDVGLKLRMRGELGRFEEG